MIVEWIDWLNDTLEPYTDLIVAFGTVLTVVVAVVALGSTAKDSRERSRPLVVALFRMAEHNDRAFELVVRNYGTSAAKDLRVTLDPPLTAEARKDDRVEMIALRYASAIPLLPQGAELSNTWWSGEDKGGPELENRLDVPDQVVVSVDYKGGRWRRYRDTFTLDAATIKYTTYSVSSESTPGRMKSIAASLKALTRGVQALDNTAKRIAAKGEDA